MLDERIALAPSIIQDVYELANVLRFDDNLELRNMGAVPVKIMRENFKQGLLRKTYFVEGKIAAMTGICGSALDDVGEPYLFTSSAVEKVPLAFVKEARRSVNEMLEIKSILRGYCAADYTGACRLLEMIGFTLGEPFQWHSTGALFRSFERVR